MIRLEPRRQHSQSMVFLAPLIAVLATVVTGAIVFAFFGRPPLPSLYVFFIQPLTTEHGLTELGVKAAPLVLIGVGLAAGFRANVWNIGAEGQLTLGAVAGGGLAIWLHDSDNPLLLAAVLLMGVVGGMAWAAIPALLRTRFNASEILTSLMLTYVATLLLNYLVHGPWRDPEGFNFPESRLFPDAATIPLLVEGSRLHWGAILALLVAGAAWLVMARTLVGFQLRVVGLAPAAGRYAGFVENRLIWLSLLAAGGLAGLAGAIEVSGPIGQLIPSVSPGYGFTAIIVAFLGRLHPIGIVLAGLLMALTYIGGETAQIEIGTPAAVTGVFQGFLLFYLLAADVLTGYRVRIGRIALQAEARRGGT